MMRSLILAVITILPLCSATDFLYLAGLQNSGQRQLASILYRENSIVCDELLSAAIVRTFGSPSLQLKVKAEDDMLEHIARLEESNPEATVLLNNICTGMDDQSYELAYPLLHSFSGEKEHGHTIDLPYLLDVFKTNQKNFKAVVLTSRPQSLLPFETCATCEFSGASVRLVEDMIRMLKTQIIVAQSENIFDLDPYTVDETQCGNFETWLDLSDNLCSSILKLNTDSELSSQDLPDAKALSLYRNALESVHRAHLHFKEVARAVVSHRADTKLSDLFLSSPRPSSSKLKSVFVVGPEGSSHHLWSTLFGRCGEPVCISGGHATFAYSRFQLKPRILSSIDVSEKYAKRTQKMLDCAANHINPHPKCDEDESSEPLSDETRLLIINTLKPGFSGLRMGIGMMSYPNFGAPAKNLRHPDVSQLAQMSQRAGMRNIALILVRDPRQMAVSISIHRHFGRFSLQTVRMTQQMQFILGQLFELAPNEITCFDYNAEIQDYCSDIQKVFGFDTDIWDVCSTLQEVKVQKHTKQGEEAEHDTEEVEELGGDVGQFKGGLSVEGDEKETDQDDYDMNDQYQDYNHDENEERDAHQRRGLRGAGSIYRGKEVELTSEQEWLLQPSRKYYKLMQSICQYSQQLNNNSA